MSWIKLDTDIARDYNAGAAMIGKRLSDNVSDYPVQLERCASHPYGVYQAGEFKYPPTFATHPNQRAAAGFWFLVDVGAWAMELSASVGYTTADDTIDGLVTLRVLGSSAAETPFVTLPASTLPATVDLTVQFTRPMSGLQLVWVGFVSGRGEPFDKPPTFYSGTGSQVLYDFGEAYPFLSGVQYLMAEIPDVSDPPLESREFFVGAADIIDLGDGVTLGSITVWPDLPTQPPLLPTQYFPLKSAFGVFRPLTTITLSSVGFGVSDANIAGYAGIYAHDGASSAVFASLQNQVQSAANGTSQAVACGPDSVSLWHTRRWEAGGADESVWFFTPIADDLSVSGAFAAWSDRGIAATAAPAVEIRLTQGDGTEVVATQVPVNNRISDLVPLTNLSPTSRLESLWAGNVQRIPGTWGMADVSLFSDPVPLSRWSFGATVTAGDPYVVRMVWDYDGAGASTGYTMACGVYATARTGVTE